MTIKPSHITIVNIFFALCGVLLCYLAFAVVRAIVWTLLIHWMGISLLIAVCVLGWIWVRRG